AISIAQESGQRTASALLWTVSAIGLVRQFLLHRIPQIACDNRLVIARNDFFAVRDIAGIDRVPEDRIEIAAREWASAQRAACQGPAQRRVDAFTDQLLPDKAHIAQSEVARVNVADDRSVLFDNGKTAACRLVT